MTDTPQQESPYELIRRLENLARRGTVAEVRAKPLAVRMRCGDNITDWLQVQCLRAGTQGSTFWAPEVGEQGLVLSVGGDMRQGVALLGLYSEQMEQPSDGAPHIKLNKDNTHFIRYESGVLTLRIEDASITISRDDITLSTAKASLSVGDLVRAAPDVVAEAISLVHHVHDGVRSGDSNTGEPR
ncbi:phage baseplate assembly protein V [Delftia tsuruhatensis]|uniref:phage baseplate assembly protein V n=1 Tax=Delftia tsuruhatensis TaxID=180282 RepID=UPI001055719D|nr:phage baseplate assembly protein V [Delftia tsuruhatensis]MDH1827007.1 phage baseplate assembly protein V [Delftia tsuruhatensis]TDF27246.1 phage baseplate assembly protein V [Delftia tsuruhatensis]